MSAVHHARLESEGGFTLVEMLIVVALVGLLASITAPYLLQAKAAANESAAIGSARSLNSGQIAFASACGRGAYAAAIPQLVSGQFVSADLTLAAKSGYAYVLAMGNGGAAAPADCSGSPTMSRYYFAATPLSLMNGKRGFATNQGGTIWQDTTGIAPLEPFVSGGAVSPIR